MEAVGDVERAQTPSAKEGEGLHTWVSRSSQGMVALEGTAHLLTLVLAPSVASPRLCIVVCQLPLVSVFNLCKVTLPNFFNYYSSLSTHCS